MTRYRNTWVEIDLSAIRYNIEQLQNILPYNHKIMGVVKADAYGHGSVEVVRAAQEMGVDYFLVAFLEEALRLRENGIRDPILVIGRTAPHHAPIAAKWDITLSVFQAGWIKEALTYKFNDPLHIHLEFETGFNRTGIQTENELTEIIKLIEKSQNQIIITGAYTHFATADEEGHSFYNIQKSRYERMFSILTQLYDKPIVAHIGNSAASIQYPREMHQYSRVGISLYGLYPSKQIAQMNLIPLRQAFSLYSELISVKKIKAGESIGYGMTYKAKEDEWIGTVPIGYADGWPRALQGFHVLVKGEYQPIVGRICMDMLMIKLDRRYKVGEKVVLIGKSKDRQIAIDDVADYLQTINYEIPCMITSRVPREYIY